MSQSTDIGNQPTERDTGWTLDGARRWWCKVCRQFTDWEFRSTGPQAEDERCTQCSPDRTSNIVLEWVGI